MNVVIKQLPKAQCELTITVSPLEQQSHIMAAAKKISEENKTPGFRPGFAPYDVVASQFGEMKILDIALEGIVRESFVKAVAQHNLKTVGVPEINIEKAVPQNDVVYRATVSVIPPLTLPDISKISVKEKVEPVSEENIATLLKELQGMHVVTKETDGAAGSHDQVTVDMDLFDGAVPLEGGQARDHIVLLDEAYYVPGYTEKLVGVKTGDKLDFVLPFPKEHYQKLYAGKDITFKVTVKKVTQRVLPEIDEEFAKKLGVESVAALRENISKNIFDEHKRKSEEAAEIEMLRELVSKTTFGDIPENLIDAEKRKLFGELMENLKRHGMTPEQYLSDVKKTPEELESGYADQAIERVKMGLLTFEVAKQHGVEVSPAELQIELEAIREAYKNNADAIKRLTTAEVQDAVLNSLRNRKVVEFLREKIISKA